MTTELRLAGFLLALTEALKALRKSLKDRTWRSYRQEFRSIGIDPDDIELELQGQRLALADKHSGHRERFWWTRPS